jgi:hypothetical protein
MSPWQGGLASAMSIGLALLADFRLVRETTPE